MLKFLQSSRGALILGLVYLVFPLDLIPDLFGPVGRLDDLLVLGFVAWRLFRDKASSPSGAKSKGGPQQEQSQSTKAADPYAVFQVKPGATRDEIDARYRELVKDYHPDRVAHLGEDLQKLAHQKMLEIQSAYDALSRNAPGR